MNVLVTGCCGFIGSHIFNSLSKTNHSVWGMDDLSGGDLENIDETDGFLLVDLCDVDLLEAQMAKIRPDACFHLAASAREIGSLFEPRKSTQANLYAYMCLLNSLIKNGCKRVVLFSSMAVYGDQGVPFHENMKRKPEDVYGANKAAMERCTETLSGIHGFHYVIIRPHNVFGPHQSLHDRFRNFIAIWMNQIMRGERVTIFGDGEQTRAPSYIDFSLPCYLACLDAPLSGQIINIGGMKQWTINQIADMTIFAMHQAGWHFPEVVHLPKRVREVKHAYTTYEKSRALLGYEESTGLQDCIQEMAYWASGKGAQLWTADTLELFNDKAPKNWR